MSVLGEKENLEVECKKTLPITVKVGPLSFSSYQNMSLSVSSGNLQKWASAKTVQLDVKETAYNYCVI